jgi:hypothetical protein
MTQIGEYCAEAIFFPRPSVFLGGRFTLFIHLTAVPNEKKTSQKTRFFAKKPGFRFPPKNET